MKRNMILGDFPFSSGAFAPSTAISVTSAQLRNEHPEVSFVIPVHNQQGRITANLDRVAACAHMNHEFVIFLDGCTDDSESEVNSWAERLRKTTAKTSRVTIASNTVGLFETISDSICVHLSTAPLIVEIQADMELNHPGFDTLLALALRQNTDVALISGRGGHTHRTPFKRRQPSLARRCTSRLVRTIVRTRTSIRGNYHPSFFEHQFSLEVGRTGSLVEAKPSRVAHNTLYTVDTVMRGPLAFRRSTWNDLNGLDTTRFFLGDDDHDLAYRARMERGMMVGYLPIRFDSPLEAGSTRAEKTPHQRERFRELQEHYRAQQRDLLTRREAAPARRVRRKIEMVP